MAYTVTNIQQSIARYLADRFKEKNYSVFWFNTKQTEVVGGSDKTVTLVRAFPNDAKTFVRVDSPQKGPSTITVPAFTVYVSDDPRATPQNRMGLGESSFLWTAEIGIDGFADNELEWYTIRGWFKDWFYPDVRVTVYDYDEDLTDNNPEALPEPIQFTFSTTRGQILDDTPAVRYYIHCLTTAEFAE